MGKKRRKTQQLLSHLFDLQAVDVEGEKVLICPLCLHAFDKTAIQPDSNGQRLLSVEHAPQQSHTQSGVECCLTCRRCNTQCGFEARVGLRNARRKAGGFDLPLPKNIRGWRRSDLGLSVPHSHTPHVHGRIKNGFLIPNPPKSFYAGFSPEESLVELKTAYLITFARLGYSYILDPALDPVRQALAMNEEVSVCSTTDKLPDGFVERDHLYAVTLADIPALLVSMDPAHPSDPKRQHHIYLPRPGSPPDMYSQLGMHNDGVTVPRVTGWLQLVGDERYEFPKPRSLRRHWDMPCSEAHPRSTFETVVVDYECPDHGLERRVIGADAMV